ncbi:MAG: sulfatase [Fimbriimonadaceae bacterium]|nr:sulfatase [Fimbriimonadaceae bacterium]
MIGLLIAAAISATPTNVIVILCDDLGYGDLGCYGQTGYTTPNIDRLAAEGARLTEFYSASPACSPSRAALLTGCYPQRVGIPFVLNPKSKTGLARSEKTLPEIFHDSGYRTACVGKWHLGDAPNHWPTQHGFDSYFGLPYSNDMWPPNGNWPDLWLYRGEQRVKQVATLANQDDLTGMYTREAIGFIRENRSRPFFLYLAHSMPHVPIGASHEFKGKHPDWPYADTIQDLDASTGRIIDTLKKLHLDRKTLVVFTSDNGPWLPYGAHAGSSGGFREGKGTCYEGGQRVPAIFWQPGKIKPSVLSGIAANLDLLPTLTALANVKIRGNLKIDGVSLAETVLRAKPSPREEFLYYYPDQLKAIRVGKWKLHVPHPDLEMVAAPGVNGKPGGQKMGRIGLSLYDLSSDPAEKVNLVNKYPTVVERLLLRIFKARKALGDTLTKTKGQEIRPAEPAIWKPN